MEDVSQRSDIQHSPAEKGGGLRSTAICSQFSLFCGGMARLAKREVDFRQQQTNTVV